MVHPIKPPAWQILMVPPGTVEGIQPGEEEIYTVYWEQIRRVPSRTIPQEIDPDADLNPDIIILNGINEGEKVPNKPTKKIQIQIADVAIGREGATTEEIECLLATANNKIKKYGPLLDRYERKGWSVDRQVRVILIGLRGGITNISRISLNKIGIKNKQNETLCKRFSTTVATRLGHNLILSRMLENSRECKERSAIAMQVWKSKYKYNDKKGKAIDTG